MASRSAIGLILILGVTLSTAVNSWAVTFSNPTAIVSPKDGTDGPAEPYPSNIVVSGLTGVLTDVNVTLRNLTHTFPADLDLLLVGPTGANLIIMSDAGGSFNIADVTITLDDSAASPLTTAALASGTFKPTNISGGVLDPDAFPAPAPAGPHGSSAPSGSDTLASVFNGTDPNGTWSLFVHDNGAEDIGTFAGGWSLDLVNGTAAVPEPGTLLLLASGLVSIGGAALRRQRATA